MVTLELTAVTSATDAAIQNTSFGLGHRSDLAPRTTTLVFPNEDLNGIMKIVKSLEDPGLLIKGVSETVENEV